MNRTVILVLALAVALGGTALFAQEAEPGPEAGAAVSNAVQQVGDEVKDAARKVAQGDISAALPLVQKYVIPVATSLLILIVAYFVGKLLARMVSNPLQKRVDATVGTFAGKLVLYAIMIFTLLGVLGKFGISVASFAAVVAAAGFAIGLAFQGTLSNFASGVLLLVFRPFKVGDVINAAGITAKVAEIDLFTTVFDTFDNRRIIVPNSAIAGGTIENITHHPERRVDVAVGVEYAADIARTRETLAAAAESVKEHLVEGEGRGYQVVLGDLGDSAVQWTVRFWTQASIFFPAKEALTAAVKNHLDQAGIGIPFPQMDVHLKKGE